jgi:hypothetical protein
MISDANSPAGPDVGCEMHPGPASARGPANGRDELLLVRGSSSPAHCAPNSIGRAGARPYRGSRKAKMTKM